MKGKSSANNTTRSAVAAVVVTFNRKEILKECIEALLRQTFENLNIIIIDNASTDGTQEYLKDFINQGDIIYYNTGNNLGGAGGFNYGMKLAVKQGYDYIWLMDEDTITRPETLAELMKVEKKLNGKFGFLSSYVQFTDGSPCIMNIPDINDEKWINSHDYMDDGVIAITRATFVSFLVPRRIVVKEGLPIKEFFLWADDSEYSKRISKEYPCFFVNNSVVTHKMDANKGATADNFVNESTDRLERYYYKFRNQFFIAKEEGWKSVFRYCESFIMTNIKCLRSKDHRFKKIRVLWKGFWKGIFFHPLIEKFSEGSEES